MTGEAATDVERGPGRLARRWPTALLMLLDLTILVVTLVLLASARYDLTVSAVNRSGIALSLLLASGVYLVTYGLLVVRRYRWGSPDEIVGLVVVGFFLTACLSAASALTAPSVVPLSVAITTPPTSIGGWLLLRYAAVRFHRSRQRRKRHVGRATVVVGAGQGGQQAVAMMLQDAAGALNPVALVDDDPGKRRLSISGVRVAGTLDTLPDVLAETGAEVLLLAIPSAPPTTVQRVVDAAEDAGAELLVLPSFDEMLAGTSAPDGRGGGPTGAAIELPRQAFRPVLLEDLLGRGSVDIDTAGIAAYLEGRVVLVTGAGGSIGSQLCREIAHYRPARLVMTDRDDSLLHSVQLSVDGRGMLDSEDLVLGDLRTPGFAADLVRRVRPDVVFHAAAIKHLTLAERFPAEAFLTNVVGTADLLAACARAEVERFVNISTDKAADPQSVLGYTKRITERLTASFGAMVGPESSYISVRFGNVLGSRGSALTTFAAQLAAGRALTITSPHMTRYFMTIHEACQLVLQAAVDGRTGEGLVLDMGHPHNIEDLARRFAALQGFPPPEIVYTGTRPGEKIAETTLASDEPDERPFHPLISRVQVPTLDRKLLLVVDELRRDALLPGTGARLESWLRTTATAPSPGAGPASIVEGPATRPDHPVVEAPAARATSRLS
ncbi:MAG TPA: polysaccharide biosynthesis protein [Intrasporangium sp.]|uniref:polysaccharide biosynthesis protein n=1 Tax=Intrasporangium sp. TaxID=1925024 RepID=UPI002D794AA3|nr:polysaccharide biosynthesis protein [Intrasporangium sp.]HET7399830.1 polysaccharide biosynthesis protein [Intrasporangium sp.]